MTWQIILYLSSILLTCILTGFLAWYAWKHRQVPGSSAYAWLALSECLLALTEALSVFSPSMTSALFWFQTRYVIGALIAVFWLVFAIEYSGHREWLSRRLLAGLFVIPLVTQVLLWSNSQHGLWMKQDVEFIQKGSFWIADITSRLPGPGYLTHLFYTMLLTLAGIALMLLTAWKMRREFVGQALLLAGAGLTALVFVINSLFNLLPKMEFNIFTPGIGLSVLLIALAVFRFDFLKRGPAEEVVLRVPRLDPYEKRLLTGFIIFFLLFVSGLATASYLTYQNYERHFRAQVESQLSAIAELKVSGIVNWRAERVADAGVLHQNPTFATLAQKFLENSEDAQAKEQLQTWLDTVRDSYGYDRVFLLDTKGVERVSSPTPLEPVAEHLKQQIAATLKTGQVTFLDFHHDSPNGSIHLALLVPIYLEHDDLNHPLGLLVLRIDPAGYLYPYISQWPTISQSAETLLVRRDGEDALFLNPLRFQPNATLNLRFSLTDTQLPAAKVVLGQTGIVEGLDYRGVQVVADVRAVPGSPWFIVSKMNTAEVYTPLRERLWQTILFFGLLVLASGTGLMLIWRQQQARLYRGQVEAAEALIVSETRYRRLFETAKDGILILDAETGIVVDVNPFLTEILGFPQEEILGKELWELGFFKDIAASKANFLELQQKEYIRYENLPLETVHGRRFYVEFVSNVYQVNHHKVIQCNIRDITERKQVEEELKISENRYRRAQAIGHVGNWEYNLVNAHFWGSEEAKRIYGFDPDAPDFTTDEVESCIPERERVHQALLDLIEKDTPYDLEFDIITKDKGETKIIRSIAVLEKDADGKPLKVTGVIQDITERKQADMALKESEERWRRAISDSPIPIMIHDEDDRVLQLSAGWTKFSGYDIDDIPTLADWTERAYGERSGFKKDYIDQLFFINQTVQNGEWIVTAKDGSKRIWDFQTTPLGKGSQGRRVLHSMAIDITERKRAEDVILQEKNFNQATINSMPGLFYVFDEQGHYLRWNKNYEEVSGYSAEEIARMSPLAFFNEPDKSGISAAIQQVFTTGQVVVEGNFTSKDQTQTPYFFTGQLVWLEGRRCLIGMGIDITERRQVEEALRESEERLRLSLRAANQGMYDLNVQTGDAIVNEEYVLMLGHDPETFVETNAAWIERLHPDDKDITAKAYTDYINGVTSEYRVEFRQKTRDGDWKWILSLGKMVEFDASGKPLRMLGTHTDITERKQAETVLQEYNTRLETEVEERTHELRETQEQLVRQERLATLGQLAGGVGHELRNPLGVISNAIYYLKLIQTDASEKVREYLDIIEKETRNSDKIVTDLLDFTRIKSLDRQPFSISRLVSQTLERYTVPPSVHLTVKAPTDLPRIYADPHHIIQVLVNLVSNACQAMGRTGPGTGALNTGTLSISAATQGEMVVIKIQDSGVGILPENIRKIFEPLFTTKTKGIGLGLSVSQKLIEANHGRIEVESNMGKGSTFTVHLPIYKPEDR